MAKSKAKPQKWEQELLSDIHCVMFNNLAAIIDDLLNGQKLDKLTLLRRLGVRKAAEGPTEDAILNNVFLFSDNDYENGYARPTISAHVPHPTTPTELVWLKTMLLDPRADYLLSTELKEKLLARLDSVEPLPADIWEMVQRTGDDIASITQALASIWRALNAHYQLRLDYTGRTGKPHTDPLEPLRLEYDITGSRYNLIAYSRERSRAIKARVSSIRDIEELPECPNGADVEKLYHDFLNDKKHTLVLRILARQDRFNVSDRAFTLLAPYDHGGSYDEGNGEYTLEISYYDFDREDLLRRILSLGANAIVESPTDMRDEIIARLKARLTAYQNAAVEKGRWAASLIHP